LRLVDLWVFQKREIEEARLQAGEDEQLETEKRVLANAEKIYNAAMQAFDLLYEGDGSTSVSMRAAQKQIEELARYEPKFQEALAALETARISVEDVGATVRDYAGGIHASPEHLAEVEDRLALLDRLKRKYGPALEDVISFGADVARKLSEIENKDEILRGLRSDLARAGTDYLREARDLSKSRQDAARKLEKLVEAEINDLAMKSAFQIEMTTSEQEGNWTSTGIDQVVYMIATNPGEPMRQLEHIASGGELSRVMLALKVSGPPADDGFRRNRYRHRRPRRRGCRKEAKGTGSGQSGALHHSPATDRNVCGSPLCDREERTERPHADHDPRHRGRRAHGRGSAHAERSQADRYFAQARRADDQGEQVRESPIVFSQPNCQSA
jgi:hypothetical protein